MTSTAPLWAWAALSIAIAAMLAIDLFLHRGDHVIGFREAAVWSGIWIGAGLAFGALLWQWQGDEVAATYYAGYLIEKALSIDNVFIFAMIFGFFAVPAGFQHKVLFWGVVGALFFRLVFIFVGAELLHAFFWTAFVFGAFLIYTGYQMAFKHDREIDPERNPLVRGLRRAVPIDPRYHGPALFTRINGRRAGTLLLVVLIAIESTDLIFAIDSVAAILAITDDTFVVWSANAFAILGLRSLYFCLSGLLRRFTHLNYGLAFLLAFAGLKLILSETPIGKLPIPVTLGVIVAAISVSIVSSLIASRGAGDGAAPAGTPAAEQASGPEEAPAAEQTAGPAAASAAPAAKPAVAPAADPDDDLGRTSRAGDDRPVGPHVT